MAAKLGAKTAMVGKVGEDIFGKDTVENFKSVGVDTTFLFSTSDAATGCAPITVSDCSQLVCTSDPSYLPPTIMSVVPPPRVQIGVNEVPILQLMATPTPTHSHKTLTRNHKSQGER